MFNFDHQIDAIKSSVIGLVLILSSTIIGLIWISIGLYSLAVQYLGPLWGPMALGGLFLLPILIFAIIKALPSSQRKRQQSAYDAAFANSSVGSISRIVESLSGTSPLLAAIAAAAAGFMVTRFPQFLPMFSQIVVAASEEIAQFKARRADKKAQQAADMNKRGAPQSPPDVEPIVKRRSKKQTADDIF